MNKLKLAIFLSALTSCVSLAEEQITVYSGRSAEFIKPIIDAYTNTTKVKVNLISKKENELINQIKEDGINNKADVLLLADSGLLWQAVSANITQEINSPIITKNVGKQYLVTKNWVPTSVRLRTIVYNQEKINSEQLGTYADLSTKKWQGKLCLRTSNKIYNQSLVAGLMTLHGEQTLSILQGWIANLATEVFSNDTKLIEAIEQGTCELGIVNNYYYAKVAAQNPQVKIFIANQDQDGVLANVAGAVLVKNAPNPKEGYKFIEWLTSVDGQRLIADGNFELPVNPKSPVLKDIKSIADAKFDLNMLTQTQDLQPALELIKQANWQ